MSTIDFPLLLNGIDRGALGVSRPPLRIVLCEGEVMRIPRGTLKVLRVLSGAAWVSQDGKDMFFKAGETANLCTTADDAIMSPLGAEALFVELS